MHLAINDVIFQFRPGPGFLGPTAVKEETPPSFFTQFPTLVVFTSCSVVWSLYLHSWKGTSPLACNFIHFWNTAKLPHVGYSSRSSTSLSEPHPNKPTKQINSTDSSSLYVSIFFAFHWYFVVDKLLRSFSARKSHLGFSTSKSSACRHLPINRPSFKSSLHQPTAFTLSLFIWCRDFTFGFARPFTVFESTAWDYRLDSNLNWHQTTSQIKTTVRIESTSFLKDYRTFKSEFLEHRHYGASPCFSMISVFSLTSHGRPGVQESSLKLLKDGKGERDQESRNWWLSVDVIMVREESFGSGKSLHVRSTSLLGAILTLPVTYIYDHWPGPIIQILDRRLHDMLINVSSTTSSTN